MGGCFLISELFVHIGSPIFFSKKKKKKKETDLRSNLRNLNRTSKKTMDEYFSSLVID